MPRKPRFFMEGVPAHVVQRGNNREPVFFEVEDYQIYLYRLEEAAKRYGCLIHAYVLMTNHVHILATPDEKNSISLMMQSVGRSYVPYVNLKYGTSGTLWEGRYKASLVQDEDYLLGCMRYIELNPIRANMVCSPMEYPWSSYQVNAQGKRSSLITFHESYQRLGQVESERLNAYQALFKAHIDLEKIRAALQTGTPLGNEKFKEKIEQRLNRKVGQARRGRPNVVKGF